MRLIMSLREGLEKLEAAEHAKGGGDTAALSRILHTKLSDLQRTRAELDGIWRMHVVRETSSRRDVWKRKVEQVSQETDFLKLSIEKLTMREERRRREQQDRQELLERADAGRLVKQQMDEEAAAMGSVERSKRYLEEIYETGTNVLTTMAGNRERLKQAHRRALDVINSVGLGESVLKLIERRQRMDIWMVYGGMALMSIVMVIVIWWAWF